jgi:hypothetical protein
MPTNTYVALDKITLGSNATSVTFSSISSAYTDLVLVASVFGATGGVTDYSMSFQLNGDTATNYSRTTLTGDGTSAISARSSNIAYGFLQTGGYYTTTEPVTVIGHFMNYANTTTFKTVIDRGSFASGAAEANVNLWRSTAAINSIKVNAFAGSFKSGSTFSLYGIMSENAAAKATGGNISSDSTYFYHTFLASGTFTPKQALTCDYLVVAGGGGGGGAFGQAVNSYSGGGGAGGFYSSVSPTGGGGTVGSALSAASGVGLTVTVGAGGAGGVGNAADGTNGSNSVFSSATATGGGGGGGGTGTNLIDQGRVGLTGGSGGGASSSYLQNSPAGGSGTSNQGYAGGAGDNNQKSGGGGGAGAVGVTGSAGSTSNGGIGAISPLNTAGTYLAGGGGGARSVGAGVGGLGGGGSAGRNVNGTAGTVNTGGGGGGSNDETGSTSRTGGAGGSGIVIVRYLKA